MRYLFIMLKWVVFLFIICSFCYVANTAHAQPAEGPPLGVEPAEDGIQETVILDELQYFELMQKFEMLNVMVFGITVMILVGGVMLVCRRY